MEIEAIGIDKDEETQIIIGHAGFIKTAEDLYEAMAGAVPSAKFGIAFAEASGKKLVRKEGNDEQLISLAAKNMMKVRAGTHERILLILSTALKLWRLSHRTGTPSF